MDKLSQLIFFESRCQVRAPKMAMKSAEDNLAKAIFQLEVERCKTSDKTIELDFS